MSELKIPKAEYGSDKTPLIIGNVEIPAYVLDNGMRVLSQNGVQKAIGFTGTSGDWLTKFVNRKQIKPVISAGLSDALSNPIVFERSGAGGSVSDTYGFDATLLIDLCDALIEAKNAGLLPEKDLVYAKEAEIIIRSVAKVGIIALVDEATGYQHDREKDALQQILKQYISEELLKWQKTFPDTYYQEIFRLNGWNYTVQDIKKRPGVVGIWTNKVIYDQLPKGVLDELKNKTPKSAAGNYTKRFFQSLTADTGNPHLSAQLNQIIAIMRVSDNWKQFISNFNKMVDRKNGVLELKFEDLEYKEPKPPKEKKVSDFDMQLNGLLNTPPPKKDK